MNHSLLANLIPYIRVPEEDIATLSLQYILSQSDSLKNCYNQLIAKVFRLEQFSDLYYVCQSVGENLERPDMSGRDGNGEEKVLCEAKFYAGLTDNQPGAYLDRLKKEDGIGLIFICPQKRIVSLWGKLQELCKDRNPKSISEKCIDVDGIRLGIISWDEILYELRTTASASAVNCLSDIEQLDGYCREIDNTAFIPFTSEELGPLTAKKEDRFYRITDTVIDLLINDKTLDSSKNRYKASPNKHGYIQYIDVLGFGIGIVYDREIWQNSLAESPLWLRFQMSNKKGKKEINQYLNTLNPAMKYGQDIALLIPCNTDLSEVTESIKQQIVSILQTINESIKL